MTSFLRQVAAHYAASTDKLPKTVFIFPNKRSLLHFRKELSEVTPDKKTHGAKTVSINEFFQTIYGAETSDRIRLVLALYDCYKRVNPTPEPLDDFIHWGNVMLSDFDNIDKYLVDASKVFVNLSDFRSLQDTYEYLTENQRKAIEHFVAHFRDGNGLITVNMSEDSKDVKAKFLKVWNILGPLYKEFNDELSRKGMAYEGKIYRAFATALQEGASIKEILQNHYEGKERFVFVGLNALNECEKTVLRAMRNASMAEFIWDFSSKEIQNPRNRASFFLRKNIEEFPQCFALDTDGLTRPEVKVVSVASSVGQTKLAPKFLAETGGKSEDTVFILPDEGLLMPLLSAIPSEVDCINITMGYPMDKSSVYSLMKTLGTMQLTMRPGENGMQFHHKAVEDIASNSLFRNALTDEEKAVMDKIKADAKQFVPKEDLHGNTLDVLFDGNIVPNGKDAVAPLNPTNASSEQNRSIAAYLLNCLSVITSHLGETDSEQVEREFAERYVKVIKILTEVELPVMPATWLRLLDGLLRSESVPFEGDALKGLQVMGTLETRALDFKNVMIMSANEDVFPHRSVDNSFIPPEIRKGFGLPTTEYQDAVWAYYFYRLLQRAENVWLVYDSRTEGLLSGEESRYIKQLDYHFRFPIKRYTATAQIAPLAEDEFIEKTPEDIAALKTGHLSASTVQSYLACPAKFYYQAVKGLKTEDEVTESLDASMIGTIFHAVMQTLYSDKNTIGRDELNRMIQDEATIRELIRRGICEKMRSQEVEGRNIVIEEVILEYVKGALRHDLNLLKESGSEEFRILGLERYMKAEIGGFPFIGFIDRVDTYKNGEIRIVDYKTGHVEDDDILINDNNAQAVTDKLFGESNTGRPKIALQLYLYDQFAHNAIVRSGEKVINSIYSTSKLLTKPLPDVEESAEFSQKVGEKLSSLLAEIADTSIPFRRTKDKHICAMCDFRSICGR